MDKELEIFYEERILMTNTQGWKDLLAELDVKAKSFENLFTINTELELYEKRGQLAIINYLFHLRDITDVVVKEQSEDTI